MKAWDSNRDNEHQLILMLMYRGGNPSLNPLKNQINDNARTNQVQRQQFKEIMGQTEMN